MISVIDSKEVMQEGTDEILHFTQGILFRYGIKC